MTPELQETLKIILTIVKDWSSFMLPLIGVLAGINFVILWLNSLVFGLGRRTFRD